MHCTLFLSPFNVRANGKHNSSYSNFPGPSMQRLLHQRLLHQRLPSFLASLIMGNPLDMLSCVSNVLNCKVLNMDIHTSHALCLYTQLCTLHVRSICDLSDSQGCPCLCDLNHRLKPNFNYKANPLY